MNIPPDRTIAAALEVLAGGLAHDLNNLIAVLACNLELAAESLDRQGPCIAMLSDLREATRQIESHVKTLAGYGPYAELDLQPLDLVPVVRQAGRYLRRVATVELAMENAPAGEPIVVRADHAALLRLVVTLGVEALSGMGASGRLRLSTALTSYPGDSNSDQSVREWGVITILADSSRALVSDSLTKGVIENLADSGFERSNVDSTADTIARRHGAVLRFEPSRLMCSKVAIRIPRAAPLTQAVREPVAGTILLSIHDAFARGVLQSALEAKSYNVIPLHGLANAQEVTRNLKGPLTALVLDQPSSTGETDGCLRALADRPASLIIVVGGSLSALPAIANPVQRLPGPWSAADVVELLDDHQSAI